MKPKIKSMLVFAVVFIIVLSSAMAKPAKDPVSGSGSTVLSDPGPPLVFTGTATLVIRGQQKLADLTVTVLGITISDEGVQHVVATHTFAFSDGSSITTSDKEVAEPTAVPGLYIINANMKVVSGTGVYDGASGHLSAHGTIDLIGGMADFGLKGSISAPE
jgi:hypothetical protein